MCRGFTISLSIIFVTLLVAGFIATGYGLFGLATSDLGGAVWLWTDRYLWIFLVLAMLIVCFGIWFGPRLAGPVIGAVLVVALGAAVPVAVVGMLALSAFVIGRMVLRDPRIAATDSLLVGVVAMGSLLSLLVHFPVNNVGTWGLLFALPLAFGWRHVRDLWTTASSPSPGGMHLRLLYSAIAAAALLHILVGMMPEIGHDGLAMHLFVPAYVAHHQTWHFNAAIYVWAVMPMFVDWLYTAAYMFAGESGSRFVNVGSILLLAALVHRAALWAGANNVGACWGVLLLLVTPLAYLESSSLFVEGMWSSLVIAGTLALLRLLTNSGSATANLLLAGLLLGGALAAKAVTFTVLPVLVLVVLFGVHHWFARDLFPIICLALLLFLAVGGIPYVTAHVVTGNPVFPFFNAYFQSPLYPPSNFSASAYFERGFTWDTLYRMTFNSGSYLEATSGAAGFQWLLLVVPATLVLALARHHRAFLLVLIGAGWLFMTFWQTAYLRYIFPTFAIAAALVAVGLSFAASSGRWARRLATTTALVCLVLNLLYFQSATYYGEIDLRVITDKREREAYIASRTPLRVAVELVNALNSGSAPVAFFSEPLTAGLEADALYINWYNLRFQKAALAACSSDDLGHLLAKEGVEYFVVNDSCNIKGLHLVMDDLSDDVARIANISVRKLHERFRYLEELLPSTTFEAGWEFVSGAIRLPNGSLQVNVESPAYSELAVQSGKRYRYIAELRSVTGSAKGRLQVNWLRRNGKLIRADIKVVDCTSQVASFAMDVRAPSDAVHALVYASSHDSVPVIFNKISFRN